MVDQLGLKKQVSPRKEVIADVVLRGAHGCAIAHAERTQHVQHLGISSVLLQQGDDDFNVFFLFKSEIEPINTFCILGSIITTV